MAARRALDYRPLTHAAAVGSSGTESAPLTTAPPSSAMLRLMRVAFPTAAYRGLRPAPD